MIPLIVSDTTITCYIDSSPFMCSNSNEEGFKLVQIALSKYIRSPEEHLLLTALKESFNKAELVLKYANAKVKIEGSQITFNGELISGTIVQRILNMKSAGLPFQHLENFLKKICQNPTETAKEGLYDFLEETQLPITPEGNFYAYKVVSKNWKDLFSNTFNNTIGAEPEMKREDCDPDPKISCSKGLHVGSLNYFFMEDTTNQRMILCEVNPVDVVAVPKGYKHEKLRCCKYKVIKEVFPNFTTSIQNEDNITGTLVAKVPVTPASAIVDFKLNPEWCDSSGRINSSKVNNYFQSHSPLKIEQDTVFLNKFSPPMTTRIKTLNKGITETPKCECGKDVSWRTSKNVFNKTCGDHSCLKKVSS